jgi:hypothetical protein
MQTILLKSQYHDRPAPTCFGRNWSIIREHTIVQKDCRRFSACSCQKTPHYIILMLYIELCIENSSWGGLCSGFHSTLVPRTQASPYTVFRHLSIMEPRTKAAPHTVFRYLSTVEPRTQSAPYAVFRYISNVEPRTQAAPHTVFRYLSTVEPRTQTAPHTVFRHPGTVEHRTQTAPYTVFRYHSSYMFRRMYVIIREPSFVCPADLH